MIVWLVIYLHAFMPAPQALSNGLHVGTFANMAACLDAAKKIQSIYDPTEKIAVAAICVPAGDLK
jgi:hypothetical protein